MLALFLLLLQLHTVTSPGAVNTIIFELVDGIPMYRVDRLNRPVVHPSRLGFEIQGQRPLDHGFRIADVTTTQFDETWEQPWGEQRLIRNHYNEMKVTLRETAANPRTLVIVFRAYDDGVGFCDYG